MESVSDFWELAASKLDLPQETKTSRTISNQTGVRYGVVGTRNAGETSETKYFSSAKAAVLEACKSNSICMVVDDFHYMEDQVQRSIIRTLKSEIFEGLDVIFIAVPHRAFDVIRNEREMEGRFVHIEIPSWSLGELVEIPRKGFPALGVEFSMKNAQEFAGEAFGSPILMQRFCLRICQEYDVSETQKPKIEINPSARKKKEIFSDVARNYGFPTFKTLSEGPQSRTDRLLRKIKGSDERVDIYVALLRAIASTGPRDQLPYDDIREAMRQTVVDSDMPQKQQITNSLNYMTREAREKIDGEPPIEWRDEVLYITDPSLMFYMRWAFQKSQAV